MRQITLLLVAVLLGAAVQKANAYNPAPADSELRAAMEFGRQATDYGELVRSHTAHVFGPSENDVVVWTPWLSVAFEAWDAARKYRSFTLTDARRLANRSKDALEFVGHVRYAVRGFWKDLHFVILQNGKAYQPSRTKADVDLGGIQCNQFGCSYPALWTAVFPRRFNSWKDATGVLIFADMKVQFSLAFSGMR